MKQKKSDERERGKLPRSKRCIYMHSTYMVNYARNAVSNRYQNVEIVELILFTAVKIAFISTYQQQAQQQWIALQWNGRMAERKTEYNSAISKEPNTRFILILFWFPFIPFLSVYVSANQTQFAAAGHAFRSQICNVCFFTCVHFYLARQIKFGWVLCETFNIQYSCVKSLNRIFDTYLTTLIHHSIWTMDTTQNTICAYANLFIPKWQLN